MKINISIDDELLKRVDAVADENYMSRSGLITSSLTQYLNSYEVAKCFKDISITLKNLEKKGVLDDDFKNDFENILNTLEFLSK